MKEESILENLVKTYSITWRDNNGENHTEIRQISDHKNSDEEAIIWFRGFVMHNCGNGQYFYLWKPISIGDVKANIPLQSWNSDERKFKE